MRRTSNTDASAMAAAPFPGRARVLIDTVAPGSRTVPLQGVLLSDAANGQQPAPAAVPREHRIRLAFSLDITGYSTRSVACQDQVQRRLAGLVHQLLHDARADLERTDIQPVGDGVNVVLPADTECIEALPRLMAGTARLLSQDNRAYSDRLRLRMAWDIGPVSRAALGFAGPLLVRLSRLVDCEQLRAAAELTGNDLMVAVSEWLYENVFRPGYTEAHADDFTKICAVSKDYRASAWLWTGDHPAPGPV